MAITIYIPAIVTTVLYWQGDSNSWIQLTLIPFLFRDCPHTLLLPLGVQKAEEGPGSGSEGGCSSCLYMFGSCLYTVCSYSHSHSSIPHYQSIIPSVFSPLSFLYHVFSVCQNPEPSAAEPAAVPSTQFLSSPHYSNHTTASCMSCPSYNSTTTVEYTRPIYKQHSHHDASSGSHHSQRVTSRDPQLTTCLISPINPIISINTIIHCHFRSTVFDRCTHHITST